MKPPVVKAVLTWNAKGLIWLVVHRYDNKNTAEAMCQTLEQAVEFIKEIQSEGSSS